MRGLVAVYYVVLRAVVRNKPQLRRYLGRCRHCWIFFLTDPRNAGREDLGCPFGCAELHRRRSSNKRSAEYNRSAVGKAKRHQREEERKLAEERSAAGGSEPPALGSAVRLEAAHAAVSPALDRLPDQLLNPPYPWPEVHPATALKAAPSSVSGSVDNPPENHEVDCPCPRPEVSRPPAAEQVSSTETGACRPLSRFSGDRCDPSPFGPGPRSSGGSGPAEPQRVEFAPSMVSYIRAVVSLIEARAVGREEVLEMLQRTKRQHSFAWEKRVDYALRSLKEKPP